jgi:hypothetical protein
MGGTGRRIVVQGQPQARTQDSIQKITKTGEMGERSGGGDFKYDIYDTLKEPL